MPELATVYMAVQRRAKDDTGYGVYGKGYVGLGASGSLYGMYATGSSYGIFATGSYGVYASGSNGVYGTGSLYGVRGTSSSGTGISGNSSSSTGVYGSSNSQIGVYGQSNAEASAGVFGTSPYIGVQGNATGSNGDRQAVRGENFGSSTGYAGFFNGNVWVYGTLIKNAGSFRIDHPLDPANKYLSHSFVESPDMMNIYNGNVTLDAKGEAIVKMPSWFEALNMEFRYQLTCIGGYAPVYIAQEITKNQFKIAGGKPGLKVSWLVTGIRQDVYANANRIKVEEDKPVAMRGHYVYPQGYQQATEQGMGALMGAIPLATQPNDELLNDDLPIKPKPPQP